MEPHPKRIEPTKAQPEKLVTLKVTRRIHDELYGLVGALQQERRRRVTVGEAITELLKTYKQFQEQQSKPEAIPATVIEAHVISATGSDIHGRGRLPKKLDNPESERGKTPRIVEEY
jgi:hypothetical protein